MNINTKSLAKIIENLPRPQFAGQYLQVPIRDRERELNEAYPLNAADLLRTAEESIRTLTFVAVHYRKRKTEWYEWELVT